LIRSNSQKKTSIGGSALIEGVMMRGPFTSAMAVRKPDGQLDISQWPTDNGKKAWYKKAPFIRGTFNFIDSMKDSYKCLMKSADIAGFEEEPSAFEKKLMKMFGDSFSKIFGGLAMVLGIMIAVGLFIVLPTFLMGLLRPFIHTAWLLSGIETLIKMSLFLAYVVMISRMPDIRRVFEYHGAEHKTIACYEAGEELTVENVRKHCRFHPRCGTSFILITIIVSMLVFSVITFDKLIVRMALKLISLPIVVGIAYEIIKFAGKYDNAFTKVISAPGLYLQRLTTCEPDDSQIEAAIASMLPCIPEDKEQDIW